MYLHHRFIQRVFFFFLKIWLITSHFFFLQKPKHVLSQEAYERRVYFMKETMPALDKEKSDANVAAALLVIRKKCAELQVYETSKYVTRFWMPADCCVQALKLHVLEQDNSSNSIQRKTFLMCLAPSKLEGQSMTYESNILYSLNKFPYFSNTFISWASTFCFLQHLLPCPDIILHLLAL